jgi:folate-binding protein YgfZ
MDIEVYNHIRSGGAGFYEQKRGLIAVWGKEAVQFLDGMITNDMKTLGDGEQMLAAFPNAQGRLLAVVRVLRQGERFLIETEEATWDTVFNNLFRFTYAGDFFVEDLSEQYRCLELFGPKAEPPALAGGVTFTSGRSRTLAIPVESGDQFRRNAALSEAVEISDELYETLRIESGIPLYGIDMDETTIVPELGLDGLISYNKGCYIGQEIIARIHFRGHVAKRLTGLVLDGTRTFLSADEDADRNVRVPSDGKPAGRTTSLTYSPKLGKTIALAYVRYDYLAEGTELLTGDVSAAVKDLPFVE